MRSKTQFVSVTLAIVFVLSNLAALGWAYGDAYFTSIKVTNGNGSADLVNGGEAKIYDGQRIWINMTFYNNNCGLFGANLYAKVYRNNVLLSKSGETYILKLTYFSNQVYTYEYGPSTVAYKVELWWNDGGTHRLEDSATFSVDVVKLFVTGWLPPPIEVDKGKTSGSTWSISFANGGTDMMYSASISIIDSGGLQISPQSVSLGNIASQGEKSTSFTVVAPNILSIGTRTISFQISYYDFKGNSHLEDLFGYVTIVLGGTTVTLSLEPSTVVKGNLLTIRATLLDVNGNPLINQTIAFSIGTASPRGGEH